jgi:hypothetical protein
MQKVTAKDRTFPPDLESAVESTEAAGDGTRGIGGRLVELNPSLVALVTWLVCLPVAFAAASIGRGDPFRLRVAMIPVAVLVAGVIIVGLASRRLPADLASGLAAGLFGGWVAFTLRVAVHGTPFGFGGLGSDAGRLAAMANRYSHAWRSSDAIVPSVPAHYPPLFPCWWRRPPLHAHRLLSPAEAITLSFAVVAGYPLWRYLTPGPVALALPRSWCFAAREVRDPAQRPSCGGGYVRRSAAGRAARCLLPDRRPEHRPVLGFIVFGALGVLALASSPRASPTGRGMSGTSLTILRRRLLPVLIPIWLNSGTVPASCVPVPGR